MHTNSEILYFWVVYLWLGMIKWEKKILATVIEIQTKIVCQTTFFRDTCTSIWKKRPLIALKHFRNIVG